MKKSELTHDSKEKDFRAVMEPVAERIRQSIEPYAHRMIVLQLPPVNRTKGGLYVAPHGETAKAMDILGCISLVVAVGPTCYRGSHLQTSEERIHNAPADPSRGCKVNDFILHGPYTGFVKEFDFDGESFRWRVINDDEVIAKINNLDAVTGDGKVMTYDLGK